MRPLVLILGGHDDSHAVRVLELLDEHGHDAELIDSRWFPSDLRLSFDPAGGWHLHFPTGRVVTSGDVRSVYWRCYNGVGEPDLPDPEQAYIAANDARGLFESMLLTLPARWVNGWAGFQMHQTKPVQLATVAALGVPIPATLLSNDPAAVRAFAQRQPASIFKPVQGGAHTRRVTAQHLSESNLRHLALAPVTLQEEIPGTNVRVFVAGERVLACEVRTAEIDFRDAEQAPILTHELPPAIADQSRRIARALHLVWTGIDYRLTPEGCYIFLEANPSPMFLGFEARCGLPLTEALIELLTGEGR